MIPVQIAGVTVAEATDDDVRSVIENLRDDDRAEQFACRFDDDVEKLVADTLDWSPYAIKRFVFKTQAGRPACYLAAYLIGPGLARLHRVSTEDWPLVSYAFIRFFKSDFLPFVLAPSVRRAECSILSRFGQAALMLQRLGFAYEGVAFRRGKNGEDYSNFAWINIAEVTDVRLR